MHTRLPQTGWLSVRKTFHKITLQEEVWSHAGCEVGPFCIDLNLVKRPVS